MTLSRPGPAPTIGLTGPIGCGKSTIAGWLRERGGVVIDADELAREVTAHGEPALGSIREQFGERVFAADGSLDRAALAAVVFADADALRALERIVHPAVHSRALRAIRRAKERGAPFIVIEAIKLIEGGLARACDAVWLVECSRDTQRTRLSGRGLAAADVERRLATQGEDLADRLAAAATRRIRTDGPPRAVREEVDRLLTNALAAGGRPRRGAVVDAID